MNNKKKQLIPPGLETAIRYSAEKSPYYTKLFKTLKLSPSKLKTLSDFRQIPLTTKKELSEKGRLFYAKNINIAEWVTTSGTLTEPIRVPLTSNDLKRLEQNEYLSLSKAGITPEDTVLLAVAMDRVFMAGLAYYLGIRKIGATVLRTGSQSLDLIIRCMTDFRPGVIIGVPSLMLKLGRKIKDSGNDPADYGIRMIIAIGEPVSMPDFSRNMMGKALEDMWDAKILSTYASTEMATSFCECSYQKGGHYLDKLVYLEILDENFNPVPPGYRGHVVITQIGVEGMPLLRYATNDIAVFEPAPCECGYKTGRLSPILSRASQMLKIRGTTVFVSSVLDHLSVIPEISNYAVEIFSGHDLSDDIKIKLSLNPGISRPEDDLIEKIQSKLQGGLKFRPLIEILSDEQLIRLQNNSGSKKKTVHDMRTIKIQSLKKNHH